LKSGWIKFFAKFPNSAAIGRYRLNLSITDLTGEILP